MSKRFTLTEQERKEIRGLYEQMIGVSDYNPSSGKPMPNYGKDLKKTLSKISADDATDYVSAGLDVIPGIGNLASAGIDIVHAATYIYRFFNTDNEDEKIEFGVMALVTLLMTSIPVGGNVANVVARNGLKSFIRRTPEEILHILKKAGLYKAHIFAFQKEKWKYSTALFLFKVFRGEAEEIFPLLYSKLNSMLKKVVNTPLHEPIRKFKEEVDFIYNNRESYKKVAQYV